MILTIDIGNTSILFCVFNKSNIFKSYKLSIDKLTKKEDLGKYLKYFYPKKRIKGIIISSVVPKMNQLFIKFFAENKNVKPYFVDKLISSLDIKTKIKNKKSIGSDRVVNVIYAKKIYKLPILVIDFGTATTIDYINKQSIYEGGIIAPGIDISLKSLNKFTAKLPLIKFSKTKSIIGDSTKKAITSGFYWGYILMIQGLIEKIIIEKKIRPKVILTGGNAIFFKKHIKNSFVDQFFTMKGLNFIYNEMEKKSE